ncbi:Nitrilase [Paramyrothecium foliicola]|nr:Nitrilase [Paramyrothecium foliicola]
MSTPIRIAACHASPIFLSAKATTEKAVRLIEQSAKHGAQLVIFPETYIPAFPLWSSLRAPTDNHEFFRQMTLNSVYADGEEVNAIRNTAMKLGVMVSIGISEKVRTSSATLYNSNLMIDEKGKVVVHHRKLMPTFFEKLTWAPGDGHGLRLMETPFGKIGNLICGENTNPLARYSLMAQGEQIHISTWPAIWPTRVGGSQAARSEEGLQGPVDKKANYDNVTANKTRAAAHCFEAKAFGILCSGALGQDAIEAIATDAPHLREVLEKSQRGVTMVLDPTGAQVTGFTIDPDNGDRKPTDYLQKEEGVLFADIDVMDCIEGKQYHDVVGGYQRMDVFSFKVDRTRHYPAKFTEDVTAPFTEVDSMLFIVSLLFNSKLLTVILMFNHSAQVSRLGTFNVNIVQFGVFMGNKAISNPRVGRDVFPNITFLGVPPFTAPDSLRPEYPRSWRMFDITSSIHLHCLGLSSTLSTFTRHMMTGIEASIDTRSNVRMSLATALVVSVCLVDSITIAYDGSLMGSLNIMTSYNDHFRLTTATTAVNTSATFLGAILVGPFAGMLIDGTGLKIGLYLAAVVNIIGAVLAGAAQTLPSASTYVAETTAPSIRSLAFGLYFSCWAVGAFRAAGISYGCQSLEPSNSAWRIPSYLQHFPSEFSFLCITHPSHPDGSLIRTEERKHSRFLTNINGADTSHPNVQLQFKEIIDILEYEKSAGRKTSIPNLFKDKVRRRRLLLVLSVVPLAMLTGSNVITYYFGSMLTQAGIRYPTTQLQINVILSSWQLAVAITGSTLAVKLGRRFLVLTGLGLCRVFFYMLAGLAAKYGKSDDNSGIYGTIACIFLFLGAYSPSSETLPDTAGLEWALTLWGPEPRWTVELDEDAIAATAKSSLQLEEPCTINFLAQGAFNRLFVVKSPAQELVVRVSLPICPKFKTESEVATIKWVRDNTSLPVPEILAFCSDRQSSIGFEWIIMEKMPGKTLADAWGDMIFSAKEALVHHLACFCAETFDVPMKAIGSLFEMNCSMPGHLNVSVPTKGTASFYLGRSVASNFIARTQIGHSHGPFSSTRQWAFAHIDVAIADFQQRLIPARENYHNTPDGDDEFEDPEDLEEALAVIQKLKGFVYDFFPDDADAVENFMIVHDDLNKHNILVDNSGQLTAVVDWESVTTQPWCIGCQYPSFLQGKPASVEPDKSKFHTDENGNPAELYWEELESYELHKLRAVFLNKMRQLEPRWVEIYEASQRQRDFCDEQRPTCQNCNERGVICEYGEWTFVSQAPCPADRSERLPEDNSDESELTIVPAEEDSSMAQPASPLVPLGHAEPASRSFGPAYFSSPRVSHSSPYATRSTNEVITPSKWNDPDFPQQGSSSKQAAMLRFRYQLVPWLDCNNCKSTFGPKIINLAHDKPVITDCVLYFARFRARRTGTPQDMGEACHIRQEIIARLVLEDAFIADIGRALLTTSDLFSTPPSQWASLPLHHTNCNAQEQSFQGTAEPLKTLLRLQLKLDLAASFVTNKAPSTTSPLPLKSASIDYAAPAAEIYDGCLSCLAHSLQLVYHELIPMLSGFLSTQTHSQDSYASKWALWSTLWTSCTRWFHDRPRSMKPVLESPDANVSRDVPFPADVYTSAIAVQANLVMHVCAMFLLAYKPRLVKLPRLSGHHNSRSWHAQKIARIALWNNFDEQWDPIVVSSLLFIAKEMTHKSQQEALISCLGRITSVTQIPLEEEVAKLRTFWRLSYHGSILDTMRPT